MPLLHHILSANNIVTVTQGSLIIENILKVIRQAVPFETQVASELYWLGRQNDYSIHNDFGPLRLPYPDTWMEWRVPNRVMIHGKMHDQDGLLVGALLSEVGGPNGELGISALLVICDVNRRNLPLAVSATLQIELDPESGCARADKRVIETYPDSMDEAGRSRAKAILRGHINPAFLALNLINCRNVTTRVGGTVPLARSGAAKRRKEPKIEFHTIVLPGTSADAERTQKGRTPTQDLMAVHRVRGHFKTFTKDAPLLGKYTGTYWWGWQVRGNKKNGMVITDYEVAK